MRTTVSLLLAPMVLTSSLALGADNGDSATAFMKCARIASDAQRLSCYDRLATELIELGVSSPGDVPAGPTATATPAPVPAAGQGGDANPSAAAPAVAGSAGAGAVATSEEGFGLERTKEAQDKDINSVQSRYVGEFTGWDGATTFPLENGQVWQQIESGRMSWKATNPMITIKRGFMGSYKLSVEGVNKSVRVKRIK